MPTPFQYLKQNFYNCFCALTLLVNFTLFAILTNFGTLIYIFTFLKFQNHQKKPRIYVVLQGVAIFITNNNLNFINSVITWFFS